MISAFHRKLREHAISERVYQIALQEFLYENRAGAFRWLPLSQVIFERIEMVYAKLPSTTFLRVADAMHLAVAAESGLREIYSNDAKLLMAAPHFALRGVNLIE